MAAAANGEEGNNVLFNDLNGVLIGAHRAGLARAPVARAPLAARARAWPYYYLLDAALGQRAPMATVGAVGVLVLQMVFVDGKNVATA